MCFARDMSLQDGKRTCITARTKGVIYMININCPCKRKKCERYGDCEACRAHHKDKKHPPYCERKNRIRKHCADGTGNKTAKKERDGI